MAGVQHFSLLRAWREARRLVKKIYLLSGTGPLSRGFPFRDQIRSAAISVMSNIAEGFARHSKADFARFLDIARASAAEVEALLFAAGDIGLLPENRAESLRVGYTDVSKMVSGLQAYLRSGTREPMTEYAV